MYYKTNFSSLTPPTYINEGGRKYDKITNVRSVYCFIEKATGDIYKPAGRKAPYTKGNNPVRANIYNVSSYENADSHGGWLDCNSFCNFSFFNNSSYKRDSRFIKKIKKNVYSNTFWPLYNFGNFIIFSYKK